MVSRRQVLSTILTTGATVGLGGAAVVRGRPRSGDDARGSSLEWHEQAMSVTRAADFSELSVMSNIARAAAVEHGYAPAMLEGSVQATMSATPRGTSVGKASIVLDDSSVFVVSREFGTGRLARQSVRTLWYDGASTVRDIDPRSHAQSIADGLVDGKVLAAAASCCTPTGAALGTCCSYDLKGMFECCGPCAFTLPVVPAFLACVVIWCNYCNASHCKKWYRVC
jgi:hypothetical protein